MPRKTNLEKRDRRGGQRRGYGETRIQRPKPKIDFTADALDLADRRLDARASSRGEQAPGEGFREALGGGVWQKSGWINPYSSAQYDFTTTRWPPSWVAGRSLNSMTLRTGPSQEIARSGRSKYRSQSRAYSTADTTLTSSDPSAMRRFSAVGTPSTIDPASGTIPRSTAPYTG